MREQGKPFTFMETLRRGRNWRHYSILWNGRVQPFGAIFYDKEGDLLPLVQRAVNALNEAVREGKETVRITGARHHYQVHIPDNGNIVGIDRD